MKRVNKPIAWQEPVSQEQAQEKVTQKQPEQHTKEPAQEQGDLQSPAITESRHEKINLKNFVKRAE